MRTPDCRALQYFLEQTKMDCDCAGVRGDCGNLLVPKQIIFCVSGLESTIPDDELKYMKLNVYGRKIQIVRSGDKWKVFYLGPEGKKRLAEDVTIPSTVGENDLVEYVADLLHEWANPGNNKTSIL